MRRLSLSTILVSIFLLSIWTDIYARIGLDLTVCAVHDGNAFRNYEGLADQIVQPNLSLYFSQVRDAFRFRVYYTGSWTGFNEYTQRQFFLHSAGANGQWTVGQSRLTFYWGAEYGVRRNESAYTYYDYRNGSGYLNLRYEEGDVAATFLGASARQWRYSALPQFDFTEWTGFLRQHFYLPTRTTVIVTATVGQKQFAELTNAASDSEDVVEVTDPVNTRGNSGNGNGNSSGNGNKGGKGKQSLQEVEESESVYVSLTGNKVSQLILSFRLAQSVTPKTGISAEISQRRFLRGEGRYLSYQDGGYEDEDILFDDPYNYSGRNMLLEITQILPFTIHAKLGWEDARKDYVYPAFDLDGNPVDDENRQDRMQSCWIQFRRPISFVNGSDVLFMVRYVQNASNDPYFDYEGLMTSLGWQIRF